MLSFYFILEFTVVITAARQIDWGHSEQPIRKRRTRRPAGPAPGVFLWVILRISKPVPAGI